jgi:hypothetical protein
MTSTSLMTEPLYGEKVCMFYICVSQWNSGYPGLIILLAFSLFINLLTNSIEQNPSWEDNRSSASQEISCTLWYLKVHSSSRHLSIPCARLIQSMPPHPMSWRFILILSSHLRLGLWNGVLPLCHPTKTLYAPLISSICATCPVFLVLLNLVAWMIDKSFSKCYMWDFIKKTFFKYYFYKTIPAFFSEKANLMLHAILQIPFCTTIIP